MSSAIQKLPPKVAAQFAQKALRGEGIKVGNGEIYEFAQGNNVICLMSVTNPFGHLYRSPTRAGEIRKIIKDRSPA